MPFFRSCVAYNQLLVGFHTQAILHFCIEEVFGFGANNEGLLLFKTKGKSLPTDHSEFLFY